MILRLLLPAVLIGPFVPGCCRAEARLNVGVLRTAPTRSVEVSCTGGLNATIGSGQAMRIGPGERLTVAVSDGGLRISRRGGKSSTASGLRIEGAGAIALRAQGKAHTYRGRIRIDAVRGSLRLINDVALEDYVRGVVANEMKSDWPTEALKAQAVMARTLAVARRSSHRSEGFDVCDTTHCQVYRGVSSETGATDGAVAATRGQILTCRGEAIQALYCSTCGGVTASSFGEDAVPGAAYLTVHKDVLDGATACKASPHYRWSSAIGVPEMTRALASDKRTDPRSEVRKVAVTLRDGSGRASAVRIEGAGRDIEVDGYLFWNVVCRKCGWATLKSACFEVERRGREFRFRGSGLGHGIGLCQWGAKKRAESGWDYRRILGFYYPGTSIVQSRGGTQ